MTTVFLAADRLMLAADLSTILVIRATDFRANRILAAARFITLGIRIMGFPVSRDIPATVRLAAAITRAASPYPRIRSIRRACRLNCPEPYDDKIIVAVKRPGVTEWSVTAYDPNSGIDNALPETPEPK